MDNSVDVSIFVTNMARLQIVNKIGTLLVVIWTFIVPSIMAQNFVLTPELVTPRADDKFTRQKIGRISSVDSGLNCVWDFSAAQIIDGNSIVKYKSEIPGMISQIYEANKHLFRFSSDTVFYCGFENRLTLHTDSIATINLVFPLSYGIDVSQPYYLKGQYCGEQNMHECGVSRIIVDGYGSLILADGDTIRNVLRISNIHDARIELKEIGDTLPINLSDTTLTRRIQTRHRWWAQGYRYPIVETVEDVYFNADEETSSAWQGWITLPSEQEYSIRGDIANEELRNRSQLIDSTEFVAEMNDDSQISNQSSVQQVTDVAITVGAGVLSIDYQVQGVSVEIEMVVADIPGRVYAYIPRQTADAGFNTAQIDCSSLPSGEYLLYLNYADCSDAYKFSIK